MEIINGRFEIVRSRTTGELKITIGNNHGDNYIYNYPTEEEANWQTFYETAHNNPISMREEVLKSFVLEKRITLPNEALEIINLVMSEDCGTVEIAPSELVVKGIGQLIDFCKDFGFVPNFRFVNTFAYKLVNNGIDDVRDYIYNYFNLIDNGFADSVKGVLLAKEFENICKNIEKGGQPKDIVNNRFKIYYGSAGTGKTTLAMKEAENTCIICNASMLPKDLMEDFDFVDGQPCFKKSKLYECMVSGKAIVLDEINLLPFDSLRFLQGILDGKSEFDYNGEKVQIADGFQIIGTMNLSIGGMVYGLPEPLVDRCSDIKEFILTAEQLSKSILG